MRRLALPARLPRLLAALLLLLPTLALAVTLRSGKGVGIDAPLQPPQPQPQQQGLGLVHMPQPGAVLTAGGDMLHDAASFLGHHMLAFAGLGATAGSAIWFGPASLEWIRSQTCYRTGSDAYWSSSADATVMPWERNVWAAIGGATACLKAFRQGVVHVPEAVIPRPMNPYSKQLYELPTQEKRLWFNASALGGLSLLRWLSMGLPRPAGTSTGRAAFWSFVASVGLWLAATLIQGHKRFEHLHDMVECIVSFCIVVAAEELGTDTTTRHHATHTHARQVTGRFKQPTSNQWHWYRGLRLGIIALDVGGTMWFLASLALGAQALWEWATGKEPRDEEWTEAEAHPAPTPTPPGSPMRRGVIPESVEGGEMKEEVKRSEPASTKAGGAIASVR